MFLLRPLYHHILGIKKSKTFFDGLVITICGFETGISCHCSLSYKINCVNNKIANESVSVSRHRETWYLNLDGDNWTPGPKMTQGREDLTCSLVTKPSHQIVLVGGNIGKRTGIQIHYLVPKHRATKKWGCAIYNSLNFLVAQGCTKFIAIVLCYLQGCNKLFSKLLQSTLLYQTLHPVHPLLHYKNKVMKLLFYTLTLKSEHKCKWKLVLVGAPKVPVLVAPKQCYPFQSLKKARSSEHLINPQHTQVTQRNNLQAISSRTIRA